MDKLIPQYIGYDKTKIKNFSMVRHEESCVNVYDKDCMGCKSIGAAFMLTFGSTVDVLDGNNHIIESENPKHIDVFLTEKQARGLFTQLKQRLHIDL